MASLEPKARVRALAELVRTSDYFTILGVDTSATKAAIDEAHHHLRSLVRAPEYEAEPQLLALAREVIRSLDEARDVLKVPELRAAYQRHLKP
jgi:DnaJ-class molecular chaperone